jgi:uncharacterized protein YecE (DUF72 family)
VIRPNRSVWPTIGVDPDRTLASSAEVVAYPSRMSAPIRLGTCSWADQGLIERWYPPTVRSAEARLRYYAERYDTVEVNSSYYAIPEASTATKWADRTPDGFVFHVKAFGMMTGHRVTPEQLPADLRPLVSQLTSRGHVDPSQALLERVFRRFRLALEPLAAADRLGGVLMQYGPGITPSEQSREFIELGAELLAPLPLLVEFRQRDWLSEDNCDATLDFLRARNLTHVIVDAPHVTTPNVAQTVIAATTDTAYIRFHGRNTGTWNVTGGAASERFDHFYTVQELAGWVAPLADLSRAVGSVYAMFNTNNADQGPVNADLLRDLLRAAEVPVTEPPGPAQASLF